MFFLFNIFNYMKPFHGFKEKFLKFFRKLRGIISVMESIVCNIADF